MDVVKYEAFLAAVDGKSFTAAAEALGYTQSGITRMINSLEAEVGFPLFIRSKKGVVLTENGNMMLPVVRDMLRANRNMAQVSADIRGTVTGVVTVGSYFSISALWMPQILQTFTTSYPGVTVKLREGGNLEMAQWLREKSVDCCFGAKPAATTPCDWLPLCQDELVVWLPPTHPLAKAASFPLQALAKEPFIMTSPQHDTDQDRLLAKENIKPLVRFSTRDGYATYNLVEAGLGISFNQRLISRKWQGKVVEIPFNPPQYVALGIAVPALAEASPSTKKFMDCAATVIASL